MREAQVAPEAEKWMEALEKEKQALERARTFILVDNAEVPDHIHPLKCKTIFTRKRGPDGTVSKHKCRIVCQGFLQVRGRDFDETFAPTPRPATIKTLLAHAALHHRHLFTLDIKAAYLNAEVDSRFKGKIYIE